MEPFMTSNLRTILLSSSATIGLIACGALKGEPQTSYCEAVCDWAVECSGDDSKLDACLEATRAADSTCADAENGDLDPATSSLVEDCVASVESDSCDGLTGSVEAQTSATPSTACITSDGTEAADAYNAARISVQSSGDEFCTDLGSSICAQAVDCIAGDLGSDDATDGLQELCESTVISPLVSTCQGKDLDPSYGTSPNASRMSANTCAESVNGTSSSCDIFTADAWSPECAAIGVDAEVITSLISFAADQGVTVP